MIRKIIVLMIMVFIFISFSFLNLPGKEVDASQFFYVAKKGENVKGATPQGGKITGVINATNEGGRSGEVYTNALVDKNEGAKQFFESRHGGVIHIKIPRGDTLVFKEGEYFTNGAELRIIADKVKLEGNVSISSFTLDNTAKNFTTTADPGKDGKPGSKGGIGSTGITPENIALYIKEIVTDPVNSDYKLTINNSGQMGGRGQTGGLGGKGNKGPKGRNSRCEIRVTPIPFPPFAWTYTSDTSHSADNGGQGGSGFIGGKAGIGGAGGKGGDILISEGFNELRTKKGSNVLITLVTKGGKGGAAGHRSKGGAGGVGGDPGNTNASICGWRARSEGPIGLPGPMGEKNSKGEDGQDGMLFLLKGGTKIGLTNAGNQAAERAK